MKLAFFLSVLAAAVVAQPLDSLLTGRANPIGIPPAAPNGQVSVGTAGPNTNVLINKSASTLFVAWWTAQGSFICGGGQAPILTLSLAPGASQTVSFQNNFSGAFSAVYPNTACSTGGQISNTWVEISAPALVFDVSREVNMNGHPVSIVSGGGCRSDLNTCVYECRSGNSCGAAGSYFLANCAAGSQPGVTQGGCGFNPNARLTTTFS